MKKKDKRHLLLFLLPLLTLLIACEKENRGLDKNTRQLIETLARTEVINRDSVIKLQCDSVYNHWFDKTVDSLYKIRKDEIENIRQSGFPTIINDL